MQHAIITIAGNVGTPPELKHSPTGRSIVTFRLGSTSRRFDKKAGAWVDDVTSWYTVSTYGGLADHVYASLRKGERVILTGRLKVTPWDNGTSRGVAADIDAEAIGHDLRWGTTTFVKDSAPARDTAGSEWDAREAGSDAWVAPGVGAGDATVPGRDGVVAEGRVEATPPGSDGAPRVDAAVVDTPF